MAQGNTKLARRLVRAAVIGDVLLLCFGLCATTFTNSPASVLVSYVLIGVSNVAIGWYAYSHGLWFEMGKERTFKRTCAGLGGKFVGEGNDYIASIRKGFGSRGKYVPTQKKTIYPKLRNCRGNHEAWTALITPLYGQNVDDYNMQADRYALSYHVPFCSFDLDESGLIRIRAGKVPVPDAYAFTGHVQASPAYNNQPVLQQPPQTLQAQFIQPVPKQTLSLDEVPQGVLRAVEQFSQSRGVPMVPKVNADYRQANVYTRELELLKAVPMARDLNGRVCKIPIEGQHWFVVARTGGGKGSWIWSLVLGLTPAWRLGLVELLGIDPKMCELGIARDWWAHYADDDVSSVELLEQCVRDMHERLRSMQGVSRKFTPSFSTPLKVIVIDEMGYLAAYMADKKLRDRADTAVRALLAKGRAPGFAVVGATQDARVEVCGYRNQFSIRIAGGLNESRQVDMVLGEGMHEAGALCEQIPLSEPGVAYVISETTQKPVCVRAAWCSDDDIQGMLQSAALPPYKPLSPSDAVKDEDVSGQLDWNGEPLGQFQYRVE